MTRGPRSTAYTNYVLLLVFLVAVFNVCDRTIISVLVDDIKRDLALDDRQMGIVMGFAFSLTYLLAGIPIARLADRYSRPRIVAGALFVWSLMTALSGAARSFGQLVLARMGVGLGEAGGSPASHSLLADYVPPARRARAMSLLTIGALVGMAGGVIYGGWASEALGWRMALVSVGLPGVLLAIVFLLTVAEPARRPADAPGEDAFTGKSLAGVLWQLVRTPAFVWLTLGATFASIVAMGRNFWEPSFLRRVYGMDPAQAGLWYAVISPLPAALGVYLCAAITDRLAVRDRRWYGWFPALSALLLVPLSLAFYLAPTDLRVGGVQVGFYFSVLASVVAGGWAPATMSVAQGLVPPSARAVTAATWSMIAAFVGTGLGPLLVGDLNMRFEPRYGMESVRWSLVVVGVLPLLATACYLLLARSLKTQAAPGIPGGNVKREP